MATARVAVEDSDVDGRVRLTWPRGDGCAQELGQVVTELLPAGEPVPLTAVAVARRPSGEVVGLVGQGAQRPVWTFIRWVGSVVE